MDLPFDHLAVYDRNLKFQQALTDPVEVVLKPGWPLGTGEITVAGDDPILEFMQAEGARLVARYKGEHCISGWLYQQTGSIVDGQDVRFDLYSDEYLLAWTQGRVVPGGTLQPTSLTDPGQAVAPTHAAGMADGSGYYAWPSDVRTAEAALKRIIVDNFARFPATDLRRRTTIAPDQGRGGDARAANMLPLVRFDALDTITADLREWAGLGIRVWQEPKASTLTLDVFTPKTWTLPLSNEAGTLTDGSFTFTGPTATRGILGGPGDDVERLLAEFVDADAEARIGFGIETFVDASGQSLTWPETLDDAYQVPKYFLVRSEVDALSKSTLRDFLKTASQKALSDNAGKASAAVTLSETESFSYGGPLGYHVGDIVPIGAGASTIQERITGVTITYSADEFSVVPTIGDGTDEGVDPAVLELAKAVQALAFAARKRATRQ